MTLHYAHLFREIRDHLVSRASPTTPDITGYVKEFFSTKFSGTHTVLPSPAGASEFLVDVFVGTCDPRDIVENKSFRIKATEIRAFIAVESELGGSGGASSSWLMKNVVEDYLKLLLVKSEYKVMLFTSTALEGETNHIVARVETLRALCEATGGSENGVLLIHLQGFKESQKQVRVVIDQSGIRGFYITPDGKSYLEIAA